MPKTDFRFLHTSDWHLDLPITGLSRCPDDLAHLLADAPLNSVSNVVEEAVQHRVDFVVISGDVIDVQRASPRLAASLIELLQRLARHRIAVYWLPGPRDNFIGTSLADELPDNVTLIPGSVPTTVVHSRNGEALARIATPSAAHARKNSKDGLDESVDLYTIVVQHGELATKRVPTAVDYWALGGRHKPTLIERKGCDVYYSGSPQGRNPKETCPHGCAILDVGHDRTAQRRFIETDVARWVHERLEIEHGQRPEAIEAMLFSRSQELMEQASDRQLLVRWSLSAGTAAEQDAVGSDVLPAECQRKFSAELVDRLQREIGDTTPGVWTTHVEFEPSRSIPEAWYEEETLRGDFLRLVRDFQSDVELPLRGMDARIARLHPTIMDHDGETEEHREMLLGRVATLGMDLLSGDQSVAQVLEQV